MKLSSYWLMKLLLRLFFLFTAICSIFPQYFAVTQEPENLLRNHWFELGHDAACIMFSMESRLPQFLHGNWAKTNERKRTYKVVMWTMPMDRWSV
ncbi:hypothetical protein Taro_026051 [Colocasia esculenta]|uniref:Uncharacterized protein n=1 Tax=Colocasia esculenta TaxID=4460 RepID=A0A843VG12_COLES|nr:hypothetical protein [Colocasia esculenta]